MHVAVFGAGAFGGWTALELARRGVRVTLLDPWGAGHARSSSGGETRIIRATYGSHAVFTRMAIDALQRWREHERRYGTGLLHECGVLWMFEGDDRLARASAATLGAHGVAVDHVDVAAARRRYPQIDFTGVERVWLEPAAGYLLAARACTEVTAQAVATGAALRLAAARAPVDLDARGVGLADGSRLAADAYVFACGPWLAALFPDVVGPHLAVTRQEVHYFGTPAADRRFAPPSLPVWLNCGKRIHYGIPGRPLGFKVADDSPGPAMEPSTADRLASEASLGESRRFLARRFPALAGAPLLAAEVCQYESTPDAHFIIDRHADDARVWIAGGGSGHGFKMGPAVGARLAAHLLDEEPVDAAFGLDRLASPPPGGWLAKWA